MGRICTTPSVSSMAHLKCSSVLVHLPRVLSASLSRATMAWEGGVNLLTYNVDLTALEPAARVAACQRMAAVAWEVFEQYSGHDLVSANVMWSSPEDFQSSAVFPAGCKCKKISD